jgi:hypothetical protein
MTNEPTDAFTWNAHPAKERPGATLFALAVIVATGVLCGLMMNLWWAALASLVLIVSLNRFFFPSRFTIDGEGVVASYLFGSRRFDWSQVRRFQHDRHGVFLSTRAAASRLDAYRGMQLLFGRSKDEVLRRIEGQLTKSGGAS